MKRRAFLQAGLVSLCGTSILGALRQERLDEATAVLREATDRGLVESAVMYVTQRDTSLTRHFGKAKSENAMFLLGSISKPVCMTALMTLMDRRKFELDDPVKRFLPEFAGEGRDRVTIRHLLTHVSGLPDQLPENNSLRKSHAGLSEFVAGAVRVPLSFPAGTKYQYSSMGILLASRIAEVISGASILELVERAVFQPFGMKHSAQGLGRFAMRDMVSCQTEKAAPESGAGDPSAKDWDWNSEYWRKLGAPWGGTHASAPDVGRFLAEFLFEKGNALKPETSRLMIRNHNEAGLTPRGLGFGIGAAISTPECSDRTFGHTGSTGTIAWADPVTETICVVLTSLPARAIQPHPRDEAARHVAAATK